METFGSQARAFALALALHVGLVLLLWLGVDWLLPRRDAVAAGEPVKATLQVSDREIKRARAAMAKAQKAEDAAPKPQPKPEPRPQESPTPPQPKPQEQLDRPDTVDQEAISRQATEPPPVPALAEQQERHRQEQAELTEEIERQQAAERRQRLLAMQAENKREQAEAARRTRLEEQKLRQLADVASADRVPREEAAPPPGQRGTATDRKAQYIAALQQTAEANWNHLGAPELIACKVRFTQIIGGEVINVEFIACPYDAQGREFVERALLKENMPYAGFEKEYERQVILTFCHPREDCKL